MHEVQVPGSVKPGQVVAEKYWIEKILGRGGDLRAVGRHGGREGSVILTRG